MEVMLTNGKVEIPALELLQILLCMCAVLSDCRKRRCCLGADDVFEAVSIREEVLQNIKRQLIMGSA